MRGLLSSWILVASLVAGCESDRSSAPPPAPAPATAAFDTDGFLRGTRGAPDLSKIPDRDPRGPEWTLDPLFPDLAFGDVVWAGRRPGTADPLYVLEHGGRLWEVERTDGRSERRIVLDLSDRVFQAHEAGAEGFAFHPDFGETGTPGHGAVFVYYVAPGPEALLDRLARYRWRDDAVDPESEEILLEQTHRWQADGVWGEHFGGTLAFGPDDYLYFGIGDEGGRYRSDNPQRVDRNLFSGLFRIDVDADPTRSHPPLRAPANGRTAGYGIPEDNPFVGRSDTLEEFWALGLRNPWGFSFDTASGDLWIADVGNLGAEEINLGVAGGNYQWSYREGDVRQSAEQPAALLGAERPPLYAYSHGSGDTSIIGGGVYRSAREPALRGHYIFGDHGSGRIRTLLRTDEAPLAVVEEIASVPPNHLLAFATMEDGEVLVLGRPPIGVARLVLTPAGNGTPLPERLSQTGLFTDVAEGTPARGVLPYAINAPSFRHGTRSERWIAVPGNGAGERHLVRSDRILFRRDEPWTMPPGTVLILHADDDPGSTLLLVLAESGPPYGATYRWSADGTDGLLDEAASETCGGCHNASAGYVLGVNTRQLTGRLLPFGNHSTRQLDAWAAAGLFSTRPSRVLEVPPADRKVEPLRSIHDASTPVEVRARSYLDVNCAPCHRGSAASFSAERSTPVASLVGRPVRNTMGVEGARLIEAGVPERSVLWQRVRTSDPGIAMPPRRETLDDEATRLLATWIRSLD